MKRLSLFLVLAMVLSAVCGVTVLAADIPEGYTAIASAEDFMTKIAADTDGKFYLTEDIELPSTYQPIDNFSGELIGADAVNLKSVRLAINETVTASNLNVGLFRTFGSLAGNAVIKNIRLTGTVTVKSDVALSENSCVGALFGKMDENWNSNSEISNIVNEAKITISGTVHGYIGGIYGYAYRGGSGYGAKECSKLINKEDILHTGSGYVLIGGIAGLNQLKLENCENYGSLSSVNGVLGGISAQTYADVISCYNAGVISTTRNGRNAAGIILTISGSNTKMKASYNIGTVTVTGSNSTAYPISATAAAVEDCYHLDLTGKDTDPAALSLADMKEKLKGIASQPFLEKLESAQWIGYTKIASADDFEKIRDLPSGKYYLAADIKLPSTYKPIQEFSGELIGADETTLNSIALSVTGIQDENTEHERFGLFKKITGGTVKNIKLTGFVTVEGNGAYAGALAGEAAGAGSIINCVNEADITVRQSGTSGTDGRAAGLVPQLAVTGTLDKLINRGTIILEGGYGAAAGIAATVSGTNLSGCENYGMVSGDNAAGILFNFGNKYTMSNCYNAGKITGKNVAGIVTALRVWSAASTPILTECYNAGTVNGSYETNPIASSINAGGKAENCSYLNINADHDDGKDGTAPMLLTQMKEVSGVSQTFRNALNAIYTVTVTTTENGTLLPSGSFYVKGGENFNVTAEANEGYRIKGVKADETELIGTGDGVYTPIISKDTVITAEFEKITQSVPAIAKTYNNVFTSTGPVTINGKVIEQPMGILFARVLTADGYELTDYGMEFAADQAELADGSGKAYSAWNVRSGQGNYGVCFYGSFEKGKTYYARPYAVYTKDGTEERVFGEILPFLPYPAQEEVQE